MTSALTGTQRGFTLLEISVVLLLIGLVVGGGLVTMTGSIQALQYNKTVEKIDAIEKALLDFSIASKRIPCPASLTLTPDNANFGIEAVMPGTCHGGTPTANFV